MRIAYVCSDFGVPVFGTKGASVHVRGFCEALAEIGHDVVVVTPDGGAIAWPDEPQIEILELGPDQTDRLTLELLRADPAAGREAAREIQALLYASALAPRALEPLRAFGPDVVYERYSLFGRGGLSLARALGVPHVLEVNAPLAQEQQRHRGLRYEYAARQLERSILQAADLVVAVSARLGRWVAEQGVSEPRIAVLSNGVDPSRFAVSEDSRLRMRSRLDLDGAPLVGFVGTLKPWHDVVGLIGAVGLVRSRGLDARLLVVGDGPERPVLEALSLAQGLSPAVVFTGAQAHGDVPELLAATDVCAAPYAPSHDFYFSPLKLFEYQAAAKPVVGADIGMIPHCVQPARTGALYPAGDVRALADALQELLGDPARRALLGAAARGHVEAHHTWRGTARRLVELVDPLVSVRAVA